MTVVTLSTWPQNDPVSQPIKRGMIGQSQREYLIAHRRVFADVFLQLLVGLKAAVARVTVVRQLRRLVLDPRVVVPELLRSKMAARGSKPKYETSRAYLLIIITDVFIF